MQFKKKLSYITAILATLAVAVVGQAQTASIASTETSASAVAQSSLSLPITPPPKVRNRATISLPSVQSYVSSGRTVNMQFPLGTRTDSIKARLNGTNVSSRFQPQTCSGYACFSATLSTVDGLKPGKNILFATAKNEDGTASSARLHFENDEGVQSSNAVHALATSTTPPSASAASLPTLSTFLPPTVALTNMYPTGPSAGQNWLRLGSQGVVNSPCGSMYIVEVLDRRTLAGVSTNCLDNSFDLQVFFQSLYGQNLIVIVGTVQGAVTDGALDTNDIGGRRYGCASANGCNQAPPTDTLYSLDEPQQYFGIGVISAKRGSMYESYTLTKDLASFGSTNGTGMFVEDATGNYNFQPSNNVEYVVQPGTSPSITITNAPSLAGNAQYTPPAGSNGFWLLVLDRSVLATDPGCAKTSSSGNTSVFAGCGKFYPAGNSITIPTVQQLATDLGAVDRTELAILTTVGTAGWGDAQTMASDNSTPNGTIPLADAFFNFGIPDKTFVQIGTANGSAFTLIGSPGLGGPLNGHNLLSTTVYSQQGQSGYIHGTLARDSFGLYEPAHSEQQKSGSDTANLQLGLITSLQPVEWPEWGPTLLTGASSLAGQVDAYKYLSWYLINDWYIKGPVSGGVQQEGVSGPQKYDIHYFFTGSLNTSLDYHVFDPINTTYPAASSCSCTWKNPFDGTQLTFTQADLTAVQSQMHNELVDLSNVLTYMVTGSTNMKDVIAAGNANTALTLIQASSEVQAAIVKAGMPQPSPNTAVALSPWHIMQMVGADVAPYVSLATDGVVNAGDVALADKAIGIIGDLFSSAGGQGGGLATGDTSSQPDTPRLDYKLDTTIGGLASADLQSQILAGFDATLDSLTGDWGRLQALGGTAVENQALFAPTQVTQNQAINLITTASQKSLYLSLIPAIYQVHLWPMVNPTAVPDMGYTESNDSGSCRSFYLNTSTVNSSMSYPTYGGTKYDENWQGNNPQIFPFQYEEVSPWMDYYILAVPFNNPGTTDTTTSVMDPALTKILFANAPGSVNFVFDEFVAHYGPMDQPFTNGPSVLQDASVVNSNFVNFMNHSPANICSASNTNPGSSSGNPVPPTATNTTVAAPASAVLGTNVTVQANVALKTGSGIPTGTVQFRDSATVLSTVVVDATGAASFTTNALSLGQHALSAYYIPSGVDLPSNSTAQAVAIYANGPDMALTLSQGSLSMSYGTASSPISLQVQSISGLTGMVSYACTGLPAGMTCAFTPATSSITDGGVAKTSFTITGTAITASSIGSAKGWTLLLIPILLLIFRSMSNGRKKLAGMVLQLFLLAVVLASAVGCGGSTNPPATYKDIGTKNVLITVTNGSLTKTTPLVVNVQ
jgi:hypothetical protein